MPVLRRLCDWCDRGRRARWLLLALLVLSFAGKVALRRVVLRDPDYWASGYSFYFDMADNYLRKGYVCLGDPDSGQAYYAFRPPLYPLFIAAVCRLTDYSADAFVVCEALISTATVALVYWITARLARPAGALAAATLYAFYPYAFFHDTQLQENVLYNALSLAACVCLTVALDGRKGGLFLLAGVAAGAAILTRTSYTVATLFLLGALAFALRQPRRAVGFAMAFALGTLALLVPWVVRNKLVAGRFAVTSQPGFELARAHNDYTFRYYPYWANIDESWGPYHENMDEEKRQALERVGGDEFASEGWYAKQALEYVRAHPLETALQGFCKVAVNFLGVLSPLHGWFKNLSYTLSYWLVTLLALRGLTRLRRTPFFKVFLAMVLSQAAVSFVFWAHTSHRTYLDSLFAVAAGVGLAALAGPRSGGGVQGETTAAIVGSSQS